MSTASEISSGEISSSARLLSSAMKAADAAASDAAASDAADLTSADLVRASAENDSRCIEMWLYDKAASTQRKYLEAIEAFAQEIERVEGRPVHLPDIRLPHIQHYARSLEGLSSSTINWRLAAVKSLLSFAAEIEYAGQNHGRLIGLRKTRDDLVERILTKEQVRRLLQSVAPTEPYPERNELLLRTIYYGGLRVSEACGLRIRDCTRVAPNGEVTIQLQIFGKGSKTRPVLLHPGVGQAIHRWIADLTSDGTPPATDAQGYGTGDGPAMQDRGSPNGFHFGPDDPLFPSRKSVRTGPRRGRPGHLSPRSVRQIVKDAAEVAGIDPRTSTHWLRHAHATHALDGGAPIHLVQRALGHESLATTTKYVHVMPDESSSNYL